MGKSTLLGAEKVPQKNCVTKILPNVRVNFLVRFASKPLFYWILTGNPLELFRKFFGALRANFWLCGSFLAPDPRWVLSTWRLSLVGRTSFSPVLCVARSVEKSAASQRPVPGGVPTPSLRIKFSPHPPPQNSLLRIFRLQPGLERKFLLRRTWSGQKLLPLQFPGLSLP